MKFFDRASLGLLACWVFCLVCAPALAATQPFGIDDFDGVYSDTLAVRYHIEKTELWRHPSNNLPLCDPTHSFPNQRCNAAFHRFCIDRGYASGFGLESPGAPNETDVVCLSEKAATVEVATRAQLNPAVVTDLWLLVFCLDGATPSLHCGVGVDRACGAAGGFGPVEKTTDVMVYGCFKPGTTEVSLLDPAVVTTGTSCQFSGTVSNDCGWAMADYCEDQGWIGGYGPGEYVPTSMELGCVRERQTWSQNTDDPESPALPVEVINRRINPANWKYAWPPEHNVLGHFPAQTYDGRLYGGVGRPANEEPRISFQMQAPEIFDQPLSQTQSPGHESSWQITQDLAFTLIGSELDQLHGSSQDLEPNGSLALCDAPLAGPTGPTQSRPDRLSNPRTCDAQGNLGSGDHDCYDITMVVVFDSGPTSPDEVWGTPVRVVVTRPKHDVSDGQWPRVVDVIVDHAGLGVPKKMSIPPGGPAEILEPTITGDGRLLIAQADGMIRYTVMPESAAACDVTQWGSFKHISEMYDDPAMQRYGLAKFPLRDHEDNVISTLAGSAPQAIRGAYPWVDRDGDNLMFTAANQALYYLDDADVVQQRYPIVGSVVPGTSEPTKETLPFDASGSVRVGLTMVGLWSQGKFFHPDTRNNNLDFGIQENPIFHRRLALYKDLSVTGTEVGASDKVVLSSQENQFLHLPNLLPETPRDLVWHISTNSRTEELAFDDLNHPRALIVSEMAASLNLIGEFPGRYNDGFEWNNSPRPGEEYLIKFQGRGFRHPSRVANSASAVSQELADFADAATAPGPQPLAAAVQWKVPAYGYLLGGARIEPLAAGGFKSKGLWLDGDKDRVEYLVEPQPDPEDMRTSDWFVTLSLDPRANTGTRRILTWPDGSFLETIDGGQKIKFGPSDPTQSEEVTLNGDLRLEERKWTTLAVLSQPECTPTCGPSFDTRVTLFVDGLQLGTWTRPSDRFRLSPGLMVLGAETNGFRGWIDDFKLIGAEPSVEEVCNHARGTLAGLGAAAPAELLDLAADYPAATHSALTQEIRTRSDKATTYAQYVCERPASATGDSLCLGKTRGVVPEMCLRPVLHFIEGPLEWNEPRPSSTANAFCLSCHTEANPSATMRPSSALSAGSPLMHDDPRRQPLQNFPILFGFIPAHYFGTGEPPAAIQDNTDGYNVDQHTSPPQ